MGHSTESPYQQLGKSNQNVLSFRELSIANLSSLSGFLASIALSFIHPFAILVFGGNFVVKHTERKVIVDDWIEVPMAAQTGVMFGEVRKQVDRLLQRFLIVDDNHKGATGLDRKRQAMVDGVVRLLSTEPLSYRD